MLVLSRRPGESIVISGRIRVTVSRISGGRVALAFGAPRHVNIRRSELLAFDEVVDDEPDDLPTGSSLVIDKTRAAPK